MSILLKILRLRTWHLLLISIISSEVFTLLLNTLQSIIWWKKISSDLLLIGSIDAFLVSLIVTSCMLYLVRYSLRIIFEKEALEREMIERGKAEDLLRFSESKYRNLIENIEEKHLIYSHNVEGIFTYISPSITNILGYSQEEFCTHYTLHLTDNPVNREAGLHTEQGIRGVKQPPYEVEVYHKNGGTRWLEVSETPVFDQEGRVTALQGIAQDITDRKRAEDTLRENQAFLETIIESEPECVKLLGRDGTLVRMNRAGLDMIQADSLEQVKGKSVYPLVALEYREAFEKLTEEVFLGRPGKLKFQMAGLRGRMLWLDTLAVPLRNEKEEIVALLGITRDITERKLAEDLLRESEERFRALAESAPVLIWLAGTDKLCTYFNRQWLEFTGRTMEQELGRGWAEGVHPEDYDRCLKTYMTAFDKREPFVIEYRLRRADGEYRWIYASGIPSFMPGGEFLGYIGSAIDISDRKQVELKRSMAEKELEEKSQELTMNLEAQSTISALLSVPIENRTMDEILGAALEIILSVSWISSGAGGGAVFLTEEGADRLVLTAARGMGEAMKEACAVVPFGKCLCGRVAVSRTIEFGDKVDDHHEIRYEPMKPHGHYSIPILSSGKTMGVLNVQLREGHRASPRERDMLCAIANALAGIIRRKQIEEDRDRLFNELQGLFKIVSNSQREWQATFDSITDMIFLSDLNFSITRVNRAGEKLLDIPLLQILGRKCHELLHGIAACPEFCYGCRTIKTTRTTVVEKYEPHLGKYIEIRVIPRFDKQDQLMGLIHVVRDMTERKELEDQLAQAQKMEAVGQLAGGVAHDFNNILTSIIGCGNLLQMKLGRENDLATYANYILDASQKGVSLVSGLLAFSRKEMFYPAPVDLNGTIRELELFIRRTVTEDIELRMDLADETVTLMADKTQLGQVLINLVANARDAMPAGGLVQITTGLFELEGELAQRYGALPSGTYARISVSDSGTGMDEKTRERIFDPFFTTKEVGKGTGLGLSIVYGIVKQHNGHIMVDSTPGVGTIVHIYLPVVRADGDRDEAKEEPFVKGGNETILFAEDDSLVRDIVKDLLQEFGYEVIAAADGEDAVRKFIEHRDSISLTVLDVIMPKMNGKEAYDRIKSLHPGAKTLFMSGYAADILQSRFIHEDGLHFLQKPVSPVKLLVTIRQLLDT